MPQPTILIDEAGIESGAWGKFRLKAAYQPMFRLAGERLVPIAVEGRMQPVLDGNLVPPALFHASVRREERPQIARLARALAVGNLENVAGGSGLRLLLGLDTDAFADLPATTDDIHAVCQRLTDAEVETQRLIWVMRGYAGVTEKALASLAATIRGLGMRVSLEENGPVFSAPSLIWAVAPDMLCIGADRLRALALEPQVLRMVRSMYTVLAERGIEIAAAGVESREDFVAASDAGSACFQGAYLARAGLAGSLFDFRPLQVDLLRGTRDNVVPLFGLSA